MTTTVTPGILLEINNKEVSLEAKDLTAPKKNGVQYTLPQRVDVGTASNLSNFLTGQFGSPPLPNKDTFPAPLDSVYDKLSGLHLSVEKFDLTVPPSQDAKGDAIPEADQKATSFQLGISATWPQGEEVSLIEGKLAIKGIYLNVVKDDVK